MSESASIGFIGLGSMGLPMARNLIKAGFRLRVYNRSAGKADELVKLGAIEVRRPSDTLEPGGVVVSMVADDHALEEIVTDRDGLQESLSNGTVHISMSTVSPETSRRMAPIHDRAGASFIAAPVFGRPDAAAARKLWICVAGPDAAKQRIGGILDALGQGHFDFGADAGAANVVKLAGNFMIICATEAFGEALAFAQKNGVSRHQLAETLSHTLFNCPFYQGYGKMLADESYGKVGFRLQLGLKDLNLVLDTAGASQTPMPFASSAHDRLVSAAARGRANMDVTAMGLGASEDAGLAPPARAGA
jgi:3-hydroxyisobutyrate dehydrogenase-like beta-hydroxyacid dehydrogenase